MRIFCTKNLWQFVRFFVLDIVTDFMGLFFVFIDI